MAARRRQLRLWLWSGAGLTFLIGLVVVAIGLTFGTNAGYAINPARDLGPRIAHALLPIKGKGPSGWHYAWIPVVAPLTGAVIAALVYRWLAF